MPLLEKNYWIAPNEVALYKLEQTLHETMKLFESPVVNYWSDYYILLMDLLAFMYTWKPETTGLTITEWLHKYGDSVHVISTIQAKVARAKLA